MSNSEPNELPIKLLGNFPKGLIFVVSAPAGTGKTTLVRKLTKEFPDVVQSVSYTTRQPRSKETTGMHYRFVTPEEFDARASRGEFLESAKVFGHSYGTDKREVESLLKEGKHVVLVIDTQGALQVKNKCPAVTIFVSPPSFKELRRRLEGRGAETAELIQIRLANAAKEMACIQEYDYHIINENLDATYQVFKSVFIAEEHRVRK